MRSDLTRADVEFILESLKYTRLRFEEYQDYPSYDFKQDRLTTLEGVTAKVRALRDRLDEGDD